MCPTPFPAPLAPHPTGLSEGPRRALATREMETTSRTVAGGHWGASAAWAGGDFLGVEAAEGRADPRAASDGELLWSSDSEGSSGWDGSSFSSGSSAAGGAPAAAAPRPAVAGHVAGMEGVLERLIKKDGREIRWKPEMHVCLPESRTLRFWPWQQHGWEAQPREAFFIDLGSVSSVDPVGAREFQVVYEGRRRVLHLRAAEPQLAQEWVSALRRTASIRAPRRHPEGEGFGEAAPIGRSSSPPDEYDRRLERFHSELETIRDRDQRRSARRSAASQRASEVRTRSTVVVVGMEAFPRERVSARCLVVRMQHGAWWKLRS